MTTTEDEEWDYEYSTTETEDFYIPIDLSNVPSSQIPMNIERRQGHPTLLKSRLRALNAIRGQLPEPTVEELSTEDTAMMGEVQITGLHTPNPLIIYNDQLLSCQWNSTIGTDMFFTKPGTSEGEKALRSLPAVDLMGLGTAKLVARVGRLRPRDDVIDAQGNAQPPPAEATEAASVVLLQHPDSAPISTTAPPVPSTFLARLNEAKARRGEISWLVANPSAEGPRLLVEYVLPERSAAHGGQAQGDGDGDVDMGGT